MKVKDLISNNFVPLTNYNNGFDNEVSSIFVGDLLSHVLASAEDGDILITVTSNINTLAVASLLNLSMIIFPDNVAVTNAVIEKAESEGIPLFKTHMSAKDAILHLVELGIK